ncbi:MAG: exodeoxyribonuclease VII large subunit [Desulfobulbaceae bacterium]|nr:exodeoxyribonuclease VII large subunit [Desulfobulbaceae bacterium]
MPLSPYAMQIQSVSELTQSIRGVLETEFSFVTVTGEISNLRKPYSGHLYFTLKDENAQIKVVLFKGQQKYLNTPLQDGQQVICRGRISVYEPRGDYQIIADVVDSVGTGALQVAFENLKKKLEREGLFDSRHKKHLPFLPEKIFIITSPKGAALYDFLRIASMRYPSVPISLFPVRVQGNEAADDIADAVTQLNSREDSGVIVLCRGGGSLEDLWAFNEEKVARAVYASHLPVVSAVGHEIDFTITDFVADHRSPTPTAAAKDVLPDGEALKQRVDDLSSRISTSMQRRMETLRRRLKFAEHRLGDPTSLLSHFRLVLDHSQLSLSTAMARVLQSRQEHLTILQSKLGRHNPEQKVVAGRQKINELTEKLTLLCRMLIERKRKNLEKNAALLDAVSPLKVLGRGYGIIRKESDGCIIRSAAQVKKGDALRIRIHKGEISSQVTGKK